MKLQQIKPHQTPNVLRKFEAQLAVEYEEILGPQVSLYRLNDGRTMIVGRFDNSGVIYPDEESFKQLINSQPPEDNWHTVCSYEGFLEDIPGLTEQLRVRLGLSTTATDGSLLSLKKVDRSLRKLLKTSDDPYKAVDELFPMLIAYCTLVLANELKGEVFMLREGEVIFYPSVRITDGKTFSILPPVSKELDTVDAEMYKYGLTWKSMP
ncbi:MAG: hypothetical protein EAZ89_16720 [Bacteroidetes bacterium]|nr:MAG: hypothetical protein EAZ89_16720 [Bacteroidota bacterium]